MAGYAILDLLDGGTQAGIVGDLMILSMYSMFGWFILDDLKETY